MAGLLGASLYDGYRSGTVTYFRSVPRVLKYPGGLPDITWRLKTFTYPRAAKPCMYWLHIAIRGFGFVVCTLMAGLMLFLTIVSW